MTGHDVAPWLIAALLATQAQACKSCNEQAPTVGVDAGAGGAGAVLSSTTTDSATAASTAAPQPATLEGSNPSGCVGWAASSGRVACVEGRWGHNVEHASWALVLRSTSADTSIDLSPGRDFPAAGAVSDDPLPSEKVKSAQRRLASDGFVSIGAGVTISTGKTSLGGDAFLEYERTSASAAGENAAQTYREEIAVRFADGRRVALHDADSVATGEPGPEVRLYRVEGGPVVVYRRANIADEGQYEVEARAWVCDLAAGRCH